MSFSLDFSGVFTMASTIVNSLFGVYIVPLGLSLGVAILGLIAGAFTKFIKL